MANGCTAADTEVEAQAPDTVALAPVLSGTAAPSATATTAAPTSTGAATGLAPTTGPSPAATEGSTTTVAPAIPESTIPESTTTELTTTTTTLPPTTTTLLPPHLEFVGAAPAPIPAVGSRSGDDTALVQFRLLQLGFWHGGVDGKFGLTTKQAVMAFQKYLRLEATGSVDENTAIWMTALDVKAHGQADTGTLVEIDKGRQLLFFVVEGRTQWVLNTSTGNGEAYTEEDQNSPGEMITGVSLTPDGLWRVNRERVEGWWDGDLGQIYRPKYFRGGVAVHGSNSVPNYPASHGCVRVTTQAMDFIWANNMMPMKSTVWVHG